MDAKSLLRAKKAVARIDHPYASYTSGGLRCSICAVPVKQWDAHLLTKQHRTSVAREKATQAKASTKRPAPAEQAVSAKRPRNEVSPGPSAAVGGLPAGFFDTPQSGRVDEYDDDDDGGNSDTAETNGSSSKMPAANQAGPSRPGPPPLEQPQSTGDADLDAFLSSLDEPESAEIPSSIPTSSAATTSSRPARRRSQGLDDLGVASYSAAPVRNVPTEQIAAEEEQEAEPEETAAEKRARLEREEKEEIMDRLEEEQRAQEDADSRVEMLKQRMEMLKARRKMKPKGAVA